MCICFVNRALEKKMSSILQKSELGSMEHTEDNTK